MTDELPPIRAFGQRSISSSFLSRSSNPFKKSNEDGQRKSSTSSHLSLSDFLDKKLPGTSVPQGTVKGKSRPFSSLQGTRISNGSDNEQIGTYSAADSQTESAISKVIFEQFKRSDSNHGGHIVWDSTSVADISNADDMQESRKRKISHSQEGLSQTRKTSVVVLGGDPKPELKRKNAIRINNKEPRPLYNHYENGCGWWDCDREGVDSEEVGIGEVWEGVGSTTLGGIEWH